MGLMLLLAPGCQTQTESTATAVPAGLPNPASVFCEAQGYALEMRDDIAGTSGYCQFPDGSECEEWAFFRGECWPESLHWGPETIEIVMLESFPIQVQVVLTGELPNSCSLVSDVTQAYDAASRTFKLTLVPGVNGAIDCDPTGLPFTETVPLDVLGLPAGNYTVSSHDVQTTFTFDVDNVAPE
jgi:putative hemolysin